MPPSWTVCLSSKNTGVKETPQRQQNARYAAERTGSDPPQPCERHVMWRAILSQPWGGGKKRVLWLTSLAKLASFRLSERSCFKNSSEEQVKETANLYLWPLRALNTHAHKQSHEKYILRLCICQGPSNKCFGHCSLPQFFVTTA